MRVFILIFVLLVNLAVMLRTASGAIDHSGTHWIGYSASGDTTLKVGPSGDQGCMKFNTTTNKLQYAHDCTAYTDFGTTAAGQEALSIKWDGVTGCSSTSITSSSFVALNSASCTFASASKVGTLTTPSTSGDVALKVSSLAAGVYYVSAMGFMGVHSTTTQTVCVFRIYESVTGKYVGPIGQLEGDAGKDNYIASIGGVLEFSTSTTNAEFILQAKRTSGDGYCAFYADTANFSSVEISVSNAE